MPLSIVDIMNFTNYFSVLSQKIYYQKVSSSQTLEGRKYPSEQTLQEQINRKSSGPNFSYSANQLIFINQKKLLKDISKNAIK